MNATQRLDDETIVDRVELFLRNVLLEDILKTSSRGELSIIVDFNELDRYDYELADELMISSEKVLKCFEDVLNDLGFTEEQVKIRFKELPKTAFIKIKDLRSYHLGKFVSLEGIIRQASEVFPEVVKAVWECAKCGNKMTVMQTTMKLEKPAECDEFTCNNRRDFILREKKFGDMQRIVIEENPDNLEGTEQPARINVFLRQDLVDPLFRRKVTPGSLVKVVGFLKEMPFKEGEANKKFNIFLEANNLESLYEDIEGTKISPEDEETIREIATNNPWKQIVSSVAPSIYGHEKIKEAIALQFFGGVRKQRPDGTCGRGDIHLLMVGDPGAGKSQILKYVSTVAPKSRYISGKGASAVGLTATVVKDEFLKGWTLEAGALVLANGGIVCLDEMDKIARDDIFALHEAMEQQSITIAKANIFATLNAQTSILAAANPKYSRFDLSTPLAEQISMPETILSRFDLIFAVKDIPNPIVDERLANHILDINKNPEAMTPPIDSRTLKKYISYAKQNIHPSLSDDALREIKTFFVELRSKYADGSTVPISPRQLEALVRLTEAGAKLRLSPVATRKDALKAIELLKFALYQLAYDSETKKLDIDRLETSTPASKRSKIMTIMEIIREIEKQTGIKEISKGKIIEQAEEKKMSLDDVEKVLEDLRAKGYIIEPRQGYVERIE